MSAEELQKLRCLVKLEFFRNSKEDFIQNIFFFFKTCVHILEVALQADGCASPSPPIFPIFGVWQEQKCFNKGVKRSKVALNSMVLHMVTFCQDDDKEGRKGLRDKYQSTW